MKEPQKAEEASKLKVERRIFSNDSFAAFSNRSGLSQDENVFGSKSEEGKVKEEEVKEQTPIFKKRNQTILRQVFPFG